MIGLGTLVNCGFIILGSIIGIIFGGKLKDTVKEMLEAAAGVAVIFIGAAGTLSKMLVITDNGIETTGTYVLIVSLALGGLIGGFIDIEEKFERFGAWLRKVSKREGDSKFLDGFVTSSLVVCIGAMAIVGAIEDGVSGNPSVLITKGILDFIIIIVFASIYGIGAMFSAVPIFILQGSVTLLARLIAPFFTDGMVNNISFVGSAMIFCVGINIVFGKKIKVGNFLPALIVAVIYACLVAHFS